MEVYSKNIATITRQWISADRKKDSVFVLEEIIYFGKLNRLKNSSLDDPQEIIKRFISIPLSYLQEIQINQDKKITTLAYGKDAGSTLDIQWDSALFMSEFTEFLLGQFHHSQTLPERKSRSVKAPASALVTISILYFFVLIIRTIPSNHSSYRKTDAIIALFKGLASLGTFTVTILFGILFIIALRAFFRAKGKSSQLTIIRLR
ncbi:hypothetical protein D3C87_441420 [compost metagenome]